MPFMCVGPILTLMFPVLYRSFYISCDPIRDFLMPTKLSYEENKFRLR